MPDDTERTLLAAGWGELVERLHATTEAFLAEHRLAIATLREDAEGVFRQGGLMRALGVLLLFPLGLPLGVFVVRNLAGAGAEWLGAVCSVLCVVIAGSIVLLLRGRPLDRTTTGVHVAATVSVVAGAMLAWARFGAHPIAIVDVVSGASMLLLLAALLVARMRGREVGRLRDTEAMDRADVLRAALRMRLETRAGSLCAEPLVVDFVDELLSRAIPKPKQRLFADARPTSQRGPQP